MYRNIAAGSKLLQAVSPATIISIVLSSVGSTERQKVVAPPWPEPERPPGLITRLLKKRLVRSILEIVGAVSLLVFLGYCSLIGTSDPISSEQRKDVDRAIAVLDQRGFGSEAFFLRNIVRYRSTDNWWNNRVGHETAYAATNFPFEVITLYAPFFEEPIDDVERAAVLLHEAYHLFGFGEEGASSRVWRNKRKLEWTRDKYRHTKVWANVERYTAEHAPHLFRCGSNGMSDCTE